MVKVFSGPSSPQVDSGTVVAGHFEEKTGRFFVAVQSAADGKVKWYRPKQIEAMNPKADLAPKMPIPDVGSKDVDIVPWAEDSTTNLMADEVKAGLAEYEAASTPDTKQFVTVALATDPSDLKQAAGEIAKKAEGDAVNEYKAHGPASWETPFKATAPAVMPKTVLDSQQWYAIWDGVLTEFDEGADTDPDAFGFGFDKSGTDLIVTDLEKAAANLTQIQAGHEMYGEHEAAESMAPVVDAVTAAWTASLPAGQGVGGPVPIPPGFDKNLHTLFAAPNGHVVMLSEFGPGLEFEPDGTIMGVTAYHLEDYQSGAVPGYVEVHPYGHLPAPPAPVPNPDAEKLAAELLEKSKETPLQDWELALLEYEENKVVPGPGPDLADPALKPVAAPPPIKIPAGQTPASLIEMISASAINKNLPLETTSKVANEVQAALANPEIGQAQKHLAVAMTLAKLGGKQRARYKTLLNMHHNVAEPTPQAPPAGATVTDAAGVMKPMVTTKKPGMVVPTLQNAQNWVYGSGGAAAAKGNIQTDITDRMMAQYGDQTEDFIRVIAHSPGMNMPAISGHQDLIDAYHGKKKGGYVTKSMGQWKWVQAKPSVAAIPANKASTQRAIAENAIYSLIQTWAATSNDNSPRSLALQDLAIEEFGLSKDWTYNWHSKPSGMDEHMKVHSDLYRKFLRAQYENTQARLKATGWTHLPLRRGIHEPPALKDQPGKHLTGKGSKGSIIQRPMSSYAPHQATINKFGARQHMAFVPIERIVGTAATGFGCQNEYEYVVLAGPNEVESIGTY